jgi:uncharacterized membrane protein
MAILALAFESQPLAQQALHEARRLHDSQQLALHDIVVVSAEDGPAKVVESMDPTPLAVAVPSTLFGSIVGAVAAGPLGFLIGGVIAGSAGALVTRFVDTGIPHRLVAMLRKRAKPGQAVVALLVDDQDCVESLRQMPGARVVYDN